MRSHPETHKRRAGSLRNQSGFTLMELMTVTTATAVVAIPAVAMLFKAFTWHDEIANRLTLNRQAREVMSILSDGAKLSAAGTDTTTNAYGFHGRNTAPVGTLRSNYRLQYPSNGATIMSAAMGALSVPCKGAALPLPDCANATQTKSVDGWLASDVTMNSATRSVAGRTTEIVVTLTHPFAAQRQKNPAQATERFRVILTRNRDNADP